MVRRGISAAEKQIQPDTFEPTKRIEPGHLVTFSRWDVVNTKTLAEISECINKTLNSFLRNYIFNGVVISMLAPSSIVPGWFTFLIILGLIISIALFVGHINLVVWVVNDCTKRRKVGTRSSLLTFMVFCFPILGILIYLMVRSHEMKTKT